MAGCRIAGLGCGGKGRRREEILRCNQSFCCPLLSGRLSVLPFVVKGGILRPAVAALPDRAIFDDDLRICVTDLAQLVISSPAL